MNINANEILLLAKKNIKFRGEATPAPQSVAVNEPATTNPQSGLNALEAQGQNNISFQGVKIPAALKNKALGSMMALSLFAGAMTSCEDDTPEIIEKEPIKIENTVIVDFSAITEMFNMMFTMWKDMVEQQKMTNEQLVLLNTQMTQLLTEYQAGKITANDFYNKMYEFMTTNKANQEAMISIMVQNGKTQEEAKKFLEDILAEVKAGKLTAAEAYEKILKELGDINSSLNEIKEQLKSMQEQMVANHNEYIAIKEEELDYLVKIFNQSEIRKEDIDKLIENTESMNEKLGNIEINTKDMIAIIKDDTKFNELKEILKELKPEGIDYKKFEEMFAIYGLSIENVIEMSGDEIEAILEEFMANYLGNETKENEILADISAKLDVLNLFPGFDPQALKDAVAALENAINQNTTDLGGKLDGISSQLDKIQATLDNMFKELGNLSGEVSTYNKIFADNWNKTIGKLDGFGDDLKDIKEAQKVSNDHLANIEENTKNLKEAQILANGYLAALLSKADELKDVIANLELNGKGGMTIDEFKAYMQERDKAQYDKFVQFTVDMGFDKLPGDVSTIKDLLSAMNDKIQNLKDYSDQLDTIIGKLDKIADFLKNADFSNPDYTAKLDKIIDLLENLDFTLECNCEHVCDCGKENVDTNEGIVGDLDDIFG